MLSELKFDTLTLVLTLYSTQFIMADDLNIGDNDDYMYEQSKLENKKQMISKVANSLRRCLGFI